MHEGEKNDSLGKSEYGKYFKGAGAEGEGE